MTLIEDVKRPFNLIILAIALLAIALAVYFFKASQKERRLAYSVPKEPDIVFNSKKSGPSIRVLDKDSTVVEDDVFLFTMAIWNAGNMEIEPADIRKPLRLDLPDCRKILDYVITFQSHPDIMKISVSEVRYSRGTDSKRLQFSWDHLDPGMAFKVRVIYAGSKESKIMISGNIIGIREFVKGKEHKQTIWDYLLTFFAWTSVFAGFTLMASNVFSEPFEKILPLEKKPMALQIVSYYAVGAILAGAGMLVYYWIFGGVQPPFE